MITKELPIINRLGLHARAAAKLVGTASRFSSTIRLQREGKSADAKSIMAVMMLAAGKGSVLLAEISGDDESEAMIALESLINDRFGEDE
jgi:phosphocarrier protein HPr